MSETNITLGEIFKSLETFAEKYKDVTFYGETKKQLQETVWKELQKPFISELEAYIDEHFNQKNIQICLRGGNHIHLNPTNKLWSELCELREIDSHDNWQVDKPLFSIDCYPKTEGKKGNYSAHLRRIRIRLYDKNLKKHFKTPWNEFAASRENQMCNELIVIIHKKLKRYVQLNTEHVEEYNRILTESKKTLTSFEEKFINNSESSLP